MLENPNPQRMGISLTQSIEFASLLKIRFISKYFTVKRTVGMLKENKTFTMPLNNLNKENKTWVYLENKSISSCRYF